jgi:16S rRNA G527 N7-methylase RsmG
MMPSLIEPFKIHASLLPEVTEREIALYEQHFQVLSDWNTRMALVSRKSIELSFGIHYADSLFISHLARPYVTDQRGIVFDLGTGAGFPGTIFAIRYPEIQVVLFERSVKKRTFLTALIAELKLENVKLKDEPEKRFHQGLFFARAVMPRDELLPYLAGKMAENAYLVTNLGSDKKDLPVPRPFLKIEEKEYTLPLDHGSRRLEILRKVPRGTN